MKENKELKWILIFILTFTCGYCSAQDTTAWPITGSLELDTTTIKLISGPTLTILGDDTKRPLFDSVNHISIYHDTLTYELDIKPDKYFIHEQAWIFFMLDVDRRLKVIESKLGIENNRTKKE